MLRHAKVAIIGAILTACTAPDATPVTSKPECGRIECGDVSYDAFGGGSSIGTDKPEASSVRLPATYRRVGAIVYGSDGSTGYKVGDNYYLGDGTVCREVGVQIYCS